jgi:ATP-binding cassette subfamily B protein
VPQDPILFHRSLAENIGYGKPDADMRAIRRAAEQAHIAPFIMGLPQRYDTLVGERGIKLSGGERQRIAIARAVLADRPILKAPVRRIHSRMNQPLNQMAGSSPS